MVDLNVNTEIVQGFKEFLAVPGRDNNLTDRQDQAYRFILFACMGHAETPTYGTLVEMLASTELRTKPGTSTPKKLTSTGDILTSVLGDVYLTSFGKLAKTANHIIAGGADIDTTVRELVNRQTPPGKDTIKEQTQELTMVSADLITTYKAELAEDKKMRNTNKQSGQTDDSTPGTQGEKCGETLSPEMKMLGEFIELRTKFYNEFYAAPMSVEVTNAIILAAFLEINFTELKDMPGVVTQMAKFVDAPCYAGTILGIVTHLASLSTAVRMEINLDELQKINESIDHTLINCVDDLKSVVTGELFSNVNPYDIEFDTADKDPTCDYLVQVNGGGLEGVSFTEFLQTREASIAKADLIKITEDAKVRTAAITKDCTDELAAIAATLNTEMDNAVKCLEKEEEKEYTHTGGGGGGDDITTGDVVITVGLVLLAGAALYAGYQWMNSDTVSSTDL